MSSYLHGPVVNLHAIELLRRFGSRCRPAEDDLGDTAAAALRSIGEKYFLDMTNSLAEVVLNQSNVSSVWRVVILDFARKEKSIRLSDSTPVPLSSRPTAGHEFRQRVMTVSRLHMAWQKDTHQSRAGMQEREMGIKSHVLNTGLGSPYG